MTNPDQMLETMIANLREKTGKSLEQWVALVQKTKLAKHGEIVAFLKKEHALGHGYANLVAQRALVPAEGTGDLVAAQYSGARAGLKPIHDALVEAARKLGSDVTIDPKKTGVSLRRARQFALIQPATSTRIDLGLKLDGVPLGGRLEKWPNTMCTHRVRLESVKDVDRELLGWIKQAYEQAT
jgi:hypothetical protein